MTNEGDQAVSFQRMNRAIAAVNDGEATDEQRALVAAFEAAVERRLIRDETTGGFIRIRGTEGPDVQR